MLKIPFQAVADWRERITLDETEYLMRLVYRTRTQRWYLTFSDSDGDAILSGRRVVVGYQLLYGVADARRPPGDLYCFDRGVSGGSSEWTIDQLASGDVRLYYMTRAEIESLKTPPDPEQTVEVS